MQSGLVPKLFLSVSYMSIDHLLRDASWFVECFLGFCFAVVLSDYLYLNVHHFIKAVWSYSVHSSYRSFSGNTWGVDFM